MRILLTNDDGILAPGLPALSAGLSQLGEVIVAAPDVEKSGASHSITLGSAVQTREVREAGRLVGYAIQGSPADCVKIAVKELLAEPPDLLVSGVNLGLNAGINVLYSGTVGAAVEGLMLGVTSIAASVEWSEHPDFAYAVGIVRRLAEKVVERKHWHSVFNINVPALPPDQIKGCKLTHQSLARWREVYVRPEGTVHAYMLGRHPKHDLPEEGSDLQAVRAGYVSITPLHFDLTDRAMMNAMLGEEL